MNQDDLFDAPFNLASDAARDGAKDLADRIEKEEAKRDDEKKQVKLNLHGAAKL